MGNLNSFKISSGDSVVLTGLGIAWLVESGGGITGGGEPHVQRKGGGPRAHGEMANSQKSLEASLFGERRRCDWGGRMDSKCLFVRIV